MRTDLITAGKEAKAKGVGKVAGEVVSEAEVMVGVVEG